MKNPIKGLLKFAFIPSIVKLNITANPASYWGFFYEQLIIFGGYSFEYCIQEPFPFPFQLQIILVN